MTELRGSPSPKNHYSCHSGCVSRGKRGVHYPAEEFRCSRRGGSRRHAPLSCQAPHASLGRCWVEGSELLSCSCLREGFLAGEAGDTLFLPHPLVLSVQKGVVLLNSSLPSHLPKTIQVIQPRESRSCWGAGSAACSLFPHHPSRACCPGHHIISRDLDGLYHLPSLFKSR